MYLIAEVLKSGKRYISTEYPHLELEEAKKEIRNLRIEHPDHRFELLGAFAYPETPASIEEAREEGLRRAGRLTKTSKTTTKSSLRAGVGKAPRTSKKKPLKRNPDWWKDDPRYNGDPPF